MNFTEACRKFIELDTSQGHSNESSVLWLKELCEKFGLSVELQQESLEGIVQYNFLARPKKVAKNELMLEAHIDTGDGGHFAMWNETAQNPYNATIRDNKIYGLGAANSKLDLLAKIWASKEFADTDFAECSFVVVGTFGEQRGMSGAIKLMRRKKVNAKYALVGQPTDLRLCHTGLGVAVVEISIPFSQAERDYHLKHDLMESSTSQSKMFASQGGEGSVAKLADNAIGRLLAYLDQLPDGIVIMDVDGGTSVGSLPGSAVLEVDMVDEINDSMIAKLRAIHRALCDFEEEFSKFEDKSFNPSHPTFNLGRIRTLKEVVRMIGTCKVPPAVNDKEYLVWMEKLRASCAQVGATFRLVDYKQPFLLKRESNLVKICKQTLADMGLVNELTSISYSTEASVFSRLGVESLVLGPGKLDEMGQEADEHVDLNQLEQAMGFYRKTIERVCG